ncbi:MAG: peptidoglycan editing factor PgeF [Wenzhouxiangella sp.]
MMTDAPFMIRPGWDVAESVRAWSTTRQGGVSQGAWSSFNLGAQCGDQPDAVARNRRRLGSLLPAAPRWLRQVHGRRVIHLDDWQDGIEADGAWTDRPGQVVAILTADCLPVLLADRDGLVVAGLHAGWRGLANGILAEGVAALPVSAERLCAWIGPGISARAYEVDDPIRQVFVGQEPSWSVHFVANARGRFQADLKGLAAAQLVAAGVGQVVDCQRCTASEPEWFFSYRRDQGRCGRQASLIWLSKRGA